MRAKTYHKIMIPFSKNKKVVEAILDLNDLLKNL